MHVCVAIDTRVAIDKVLVHVAIRILKSRCSTIFLHQRLHQPL
jgi:hypothetical protein